MGHSYAELNLECNNFECPKRGYSCPHTTARVEDCQIWAKLIADDPELETRRQAKEVAELKNTNVFGGASWYGEAVPSSKTHWLNRY